MGVAPHENIRLQVSIILLRVLGDVIRQRLKVNPSLELARLESFLDKAPESTVILMPQEVYVGNKRYRVDAVFGGVMAFDYKSSEREFDQAEADAVSKYLPRLKKVRYFVVTNYYSWRIYRVWREHGVRLNEIYRGDREGALGVLKQIIASEVKALKVPPHPASVEALYTMSSDELIKDLREVFDNVKENDKVKPLFEAYKKIMKMLYSGETPLGEEFYSDLFVKHTLMHMMVMASLVAALGLEDNPLDTCSGVALKADEGILDVALPYLNWWKIAYRDMKEELKVKINKIVGDVAVRAHLVDWELGSGEDVFRGLYEFLVEPETRRKIGEYYTPLWMVDMILRDFELKNKLVLDPFCGSGTFLVRAFYKKIKEGEDPSRAYEELVGFDVNPLAVAVARAELIIAYRIVTGKNPPTPPRIYHTDTLAIWYGGKAAILEDPEYTGIIDIVNNYIGTNNLLYRSVLAKTEPWKTLSSLSRIERLLAQGIRMSLSISGDFVSELRDYLLRHLRKDDLLENTFRGIVEKTLFLQKLSELVKKYGNGVWATTIISATMPSIAVFLKPHIIVTNPPWVQMTKYQSGYSESIRKVMSKVLKNALKVESKKAASMVTGSDVACAALYKALEIAKEGVGFVMPREQSFYSKSPMRSGILLTYAIIKKVCGDGYEKCDVKLVDIDYDSFGHGNYPALVIVKKECGSETDGERRAS